MIEQSLCHHLQAQLTEYYRLVAVLESQMSDSGGSVREGDDVREGETGLTLKRLDVWINEWRLRMRMMSVCVESARGNTDCSSDGKYETDASATADTQGGALVNLIHGYTDNGDPFVRHFTDHLLEEVRASIPAPLHANSGCTVGIQALLRDSSQMALFRRTLRPLLRILRLP